MKSSISLKSKFALALTLSCIVSILIVGVVANIMVERQFKSIADERVFLTFESHVIEYYSKYGFDMNDEAALVEWMSLLETGEEAPQNFQPQEAPSDTGIRLGGSPPNGGPPPPPGGRPPARGPPTGGQLHPADPYILLTEDNKVLLGAGIYAFGSTLDEDKINNPSSIEYQGEIIAYAFPASAITFNDNEKKYLEALRNSLIWGAIPAVAFSLFLALFLGRYFGKRLNRLSTALSQLGEGDFQHTVQLDHEDESNDELGQLATTFNKMASQLAISNEKIVAQAEELSELSHRDELTGLYNRRYANTQASDHIARGARYGRPLSIAMCDIDNFKAINDTYLHEIGDEVLIAIGKILSSNLREVDTVARYGGEEFVVIFPETTHEKAAVLSERLREAIAQFEWHTIAKDLSVTISIGISSNDSMDKFESILSTADKNLYEAKNSGKNKVIS